MYRKCGFLWEVFHVKWERLRRRKYNTCMHIEIDAQHTSNTRVVCANTNKLHECIYADTWHPTNVCTHERTHVHIFSMKRFLPLLSCLRSIPIFDADRLFSDTFIFLFSFAPGYSMQEHSAWSEMVHTNGRNDASKPTLIHSSSRRRCDEP